VRNLSILVIGGTSFFGKEIVEQLVEAGHTVSVLSRGNQKPGVLEKVNHIVADRTDQSDFSAKVGGQSFDVVIDNIAYNETDVKNAVEVFKGNVGRYVFTSSAVLSYTGDMTMPAVEENCNFDFQPPEEEKDSRLWTYTMGKTHGERYLNNQSELEFAIVRPPIVLGPDDLTLRGYFYFQRLMDGKPLIVTNGGVQSFRIVYSEDLARGYLLAMAHPNARNNTYNIVQQEVISLKMLLNESAKALGTEPNLVDITQAVMQNAEYKYPETYAPMQNFILSVEKAERELGYTSTPFNEWIATTALWYRDVYKGKDSPGYENRDQEVQFAQEYMEAVSGLKV